MPKGPPPRRFTVSPRWDRTANYYDGKSISLQMSGFGMLLYLECRHLRGDPAPTRTELVEVLPLSERTIDGTLANLTRYGLIIGTA